MAKAIHPEPANSVTTASICPTDTGNIKPEFVRLPDLKRLFGIKRSTAYNLVARGAIKAVTLRQRGSRTGIKLISVDSVREYIVGCMDAQPSQKAHRGRQ